MTQRSLTNDRMLRYKCMPHACFTNTLVAGTTSRQGHKYADTYCMSFGWTRAHPMKQKGDAHETRSLLFHHDGVPPVMIMDGSKEQTLGDFSRKLRQADCHRKQTEPYSPWMNAAEGCIHPWQDPTFTSAMSVDLAGMTGSCYVTQHPAFPTIK